MKRRRNLIVAVSLVALIGALWVGQAALKATATAQGAQMVQAPRFEVDPLWPKPLPNDWLLGNTIGVWVDDQDVIWIIHRSSASLENQERGAEANPPTGECCRGAPPVLAFDKQGNLVRSWGAKPGETGPGWEWPMSNHGIFVDHQGYVWIGGNNRGDSHILKFTKDGRFVAQYGKANARRTGTGPDAQPTYAGDSNDSRNFWGVAKIFVDSRDNEAYVADGYFNKRVAVLDANTGAMKRHWGAYGNRPDDSYVFPPRNPSSPPAQQFRGPVHCADLSVDNLVYVCDRQSNRLQVFTKEGRFVKEAFIAPNSLGEGSTWDVAFSRDPQQRYLFLADGRNMKVRVLLRETLEEITNFGDGGRQPGLFYAVHSIAIDSEGNLYTTETYRGQRVQKFVYRGMGSVAKVQGAPWPTGN